MKRIGRVLAGAWKRGQARSRISAGQTPPAESYRPHQAVNLLP